jgi:ABC-type sugar transport system ATPase subunit
MPAVALRSLTKRFAAGAAALDDLTLDVMSGEFLVLLGPSGCGKTTALRCIAGLEEPTAGDIAIDGVRVNDLPPKDRDVAMVFQNYALYPHLTVRENIGFPLAMRRVARAEREVRVAEAAAALELTPLLDRKPAQLSGGERQRVALGRAIVRQPKVFLFDEPLAATMLYVTHDQVEAMTMGQRIAILHRGALQQVGTPAEIYARPANTFVAGFIGAPGMNVLDAQTHRRTGAQFVGFRPEDARLVPAEGAPFAGTVTLVELLGAEALVHLRLDGGESAVVRLRGEAPPEVDLRVGVAVADDRLHAFDAEGRRLGP